MNAKDILVHIDSRATCAARLATAILLAKHQQAKLTGLYAIPPYQDKQYDLPYKLAEQAEQKFARAVADAGLESEWICVNTAASDLDLMQSINLYAHYRDLLIVSQSDPETEDLSIPRELPENAILGAGRPVLVVPYACDTRTVGKRIMLVWRGGPESSRALHDSMNLLRSAESVHVISIQGYGGDESYESHNADICSHLARYDINAIGEKHVTGDLSVGDLLLNRSADEGIDLLVMGAFTQFRRGHQMLGEVGQYLLKYMTVPVLMSH